MKKILAILVAAFAFVAVASAQPRAFGVRIGYGAEISYQYSVSNATFAEMDLGLIGDKGWYVSGLFDFILGSAGQVNFYAGPGIQLGTRNYEETDGGNIFKFDAAIVGQIGAEFEIPGAPINISLDWRPAIYFNHGGFGWTGFGLAIRYRY